MVPVINKPTRVTKNTATTIDHIITHSLLHRTINTGIIKLDISDHFPIFLIAETEKRITPEGKVQIKKRLIDNKTKEKCENALQDMNCPDIIRSKQTDSAYEVFLNKFNSLYDKVYEKYVVTVKWKTLKKPVDDKRNYKIFKNKAKAI